MKERGNTVRLTSGAGFTLVEVALALMVIGIGLMAVFGLFTSGLDTDKASLDDTMAAFFAQDVMSAILAKAVVTPWAQIPDLRIIPAAMDQWLPATIDDLKVRDTDGQWRVNRYFNRYTTPAYMEYALRYRLDIDTADAFLGFARLDVLPGEFGPADNIKSFYIEFTNVSP